MVEIILLSFTLDLLFLGASQKYGQALDPLAHTQITIVVAIEGPEDTVHQDIVRHVEWIVEHIAELQAVHAIEIFSDGFEHVQQRLNFRLANLEMEKN